MAAAFQVPTVLPCSMDALEPARGTVTGWAFFRSVLILLCTTITINQQRTIKLLLFLRCAKISMCASRDDYLPLYSPRAKEIAKNGLHTHVLQKGQLRYFITHALRTRPLVH